jgi:hypothetical protein
MKTALITGAAGYLGSHLAKSLKKSGWKVVGLGHKRHTMNQYLDIMHYADVRNMHDVDDLFSRIQFDTVFHLAARIEAGVSVKEPTEFYSVNTGGTSSYSWINNDPSIGLSATGTGTSQSFIATNSGSTPVVASIIVTPTFTNAGVTCSGPTKSYTITVNPSADVNQPASQVVCAGSATAAISFTSNNTLGTTTYTWTNNNPSIGLGASGSSDSIASFTAINNGSAPAVATIIVTPTYTYYGVTCNGPTKTFTITVNPNGQVNQTAAQVFCNGNQAVINLTSQNTVGITNYSWTAYIYFSCRWFHLLAF